MRYTGWGRLSLRGKPFTKQACRTGMSAAFLPSLLTRCRRGSTSSSAFSKFDFGSHCGVRQQTCALFKLVALFTDASRASRCSWMQWRIFSRLLVDCEGPSNIAQKAPRGWLLLIFSRLDLVTLRSKTGDGVVAGDRLFNALLSIGNAEALGRGLDVDVRGSRTQFNKLAVRMARPLLNFAAVLQRDNLAYDETVYRQREVTKWRWLMNEPMHFGV